MGRPTQGTSVALDFVQRVVYDFFRTTIGGPPMAPAESRAKTRGSDTPKPASNDFSKDQDLQAYRDMLLIRRFEEKAGQMYGMGLIGGFCHLYIGQEAIVVGMQMASKEGDEVITGYRDHGHMLACGME